ncbi:MAG: hypothetical protein ACREML_14610 [Vulcanimicrobiaceae bacterium]
MEEVAELTVDDAEETVDADVDVTLETAFDALLTVESIDLVAALVVEEVEDPTAFATDVVALC